MIHYKKGKKRNKKIHQGRPFTEEELKELMGVHNPVYKRAKGGAFRQR
ncbi:MAG: hypothetical protein ACE3JK_01105 [Sporolactobacillus sp.]